MNKSALYILPLIDGWSASADYPSNCYCKIDITESIILEYCQDSFVPHNNGTILSHKNNVSTKILYNIDKKYLEDYRLLMNGKYSEISNDAKAVILSRSPSSDKFRTTEQVLYKNSRLKKLIEKQLDIEDLDKLVGEYESKFGKDEELSIQDED